MPRRSTRATRDKFLNWRNTDVSISSTFAENNSISTDVLAAGASGRTQAWEIYHWVVNHSIPIDAPVGGSTTEFLSAFINHSTGLSAVPDVGDTGYIDGFRVVFYGSQNATIAFGAVTYPNGGNNMHRSLMDIFGEVEVYVDDTLHIYSQSSYSGAVVVPIGIGWKWVMLTNQRLLELIQKYQ